MIKIDVPYIDQSGRYPTGCESVSAVMLLQYLGYNISVDEFIHDCLECREMKEKDGILFGPDPFQYFCGSPYDENAFGCYAPVIRKALQKVVKDRYQVIDETGTSMERLLEEYIEKAIPVVFWACINMREEIEGPMWRLLDTGELFTWKSNEHCMLLVGYDAECYYFNDPYDNNGVIGYPKDLTKRRHEAQYAMAVGVKKKE